VFEAVFAALVLAVCLALLLRLMLGTKRRQRVDAVLKRAWHASRSRLLSLWRWRAQKRQQASAAEEAARIAQEAIRRARASAEREGNVIRPKAFRRETGEPRKPH
jgi:hypothetical protein